MIGSLEPGAARRGGRLAGIAAAGLVVALLAVAPAASAESVTSPTGMLSVSVPPPVTAGVAATYTMTFTNGTSQPMSGVTAAASMPAGMTVQRITGCTRVGGNQSVSFLCALPNLAPGVSESATVSLLASGTGTFTIPFSADGNVPVAGSPGTFQVVGDTASLSVNVQPGATNIQVTGSSSNGAPAVGSTFNYTFQVKNDGPLPAFGVTFDDALPPAIALGGTLSTDHGTCAASVLSNSVHCDIGSLADGQQSNITLSASPKASGVFGNTASIAMSGSDTQPSNNSVTVTVQSK